MATGPMTGLNPIGVAGEAPYNGGFNTYNVASGYATALYTGDVVKLNASTGMVEKAAAGDVALGVVIGFQYTDSNGVPQHKPFFPAAFTSTQPIYAKVVDHPMMRYETVADAAVTSVAVGTLYGPTLSAGTTFNGNSGTKVGVAAGTVVAGSSMFRIVGVTDIDNRVLEVILSRSLYRDNA